VFAPLSIVALLAGWGIVGVWCAIYAFILARLLTLAVRFMGNRWVTA